MIERSKTGVLYSGYNDRKKRDCSVFRSKVAHVASVTATVHGRSLPFGTVCQYDYSRTGHLVSIRCAQFPRYRGNKPIQVHVAVYDAIWDEWSVELESFNDGVPDRLWDYWQRLKCAPEKGLAYKLDCGNTASFMQSAITRKKSSGGVVDAKHVHDITDYSGSKTVPYKDFTGSMPVLSGNYSETHSAYSRC